MAVAALCLCAVVAMPGCLTGSQKPAPVIHYGMNGGADSAGVHTVGRGDTLWRISERYKISMQDLIHVNRLSPPYELAVNQRLTLPPPQTYRVRQGDSIYRISQTFNVSPTEIARLNNLAAPYTLHKGDSVRLPSVRPSETAAAAAAATPTRKPQQTAAATRPPPPKLPSATPPRSSGRFAWPVDGPVISTYGPKEGGLHNDGINIRAARGTPVRAAENGVVVYANNELKGFGNLVLVRHADQWMTAYAHMDRIIVKRGQEVRAGDQIGTVGQTGSVDSPQLHFEVRRGTKALNPEAYLASPRS